MKLAACFTGLITVIIIFRAGAAEKEKGLEDDARPRHKGSRKPCRGPWGKHGAVRQDGCLSSTCRNGKWITVMRKAVCCFNRQAFPINTIIESEVEGNCSQQITCDGQAKLTFTKPTCAAPDLQDILGGMNQISQKIEGGTAEMSAEFENIREDLQSFGQTFENETTALKTLQNLTSAVKTEVMTNGEKLANLQSQIQNMSDELKKEMKDISGAMVNLEKEIKSSMGTLNATVNTVNTLTTDMNTLNTDVNTLNTDMNTINTDMNTLNTDVNTLYTDVATLNTDMNTLNTDVHICVYKDVMSGTTGTVTYTDTNDKTLTNIASDGSQINNSTGIFTAVSTGVYSLTFTATTTKYTVINIYVDNSEMGSTQYYYSNQDSGDQGTGQWDQGSRTVTLCLEKGQNVKIGVSKNTGSVYYLTWCLSLEKKRSCYGHL